MFDWPSRSLVGSVDHPHNLVDRQTVSSVVSRLNYTVLAHGRDLLTNVSRLHIDYLSLLVNQLQCVFMHLQHKSNLLATVEVHEVLGVEGTLNPLFGIQSCDKVRVCFRFDLELVSVDANLLL